VPPGTADDANDAAYGIMIKAGYHLGLNYNHGRKYSMIHWLQGNQAVVASSSSAFDPVKRCHVAGVVDRAAGVVRLYVNGKLEGESPFAALQILSGNRRWMLAMESANPLAPGGGTCAHLITTLSRLRLVKLLSRQ
jgi:hypothetical protein